MLIRPVPDAPSKQHPQETKLKMKNLLGNTPIPVPPACLPMLAPVRCLRRMHAAAGRSGKLWATFIPSSSQEGEPGAPPRGVSILARDFQVVTLYKADGTFAGVRRIGSGNPIEVDGMRIYIDGVVGSTGLELKVDPGVPLVYAGFGGRPCGTAHIIWSRPIYEVLVCHFQIAPCICYKWVCTRWRDSAGLAD